MPGESVPHQNITKQLAESQITASTIKKEINVDDIKGRTCYFSLAGDLAIKAFENLEFSTFDEDDKKRN